MRVLRIGVLLLALVAALVLAVAYAFPRHVHVERSTTIEAPPSAVYTLVSGFRSFPSWSPWHGDYRREGPEVGVGAKALWSGGSLEIVGADPLERVRMRLELGTARPAAAELHLLPDTDTTRVIWSYDTDVGTNPLARYFGRWFDGAIGPQLEVGLTRLKSVAEQLPRADFADLEVTLVDVVPVLVAYTEGPSGGDALASLGSAYARIDKFLADRRLTQAGARIRVPASREESGPAFEAAVPIEHEPEKPVPANSPVQVHRSPGGTALRAVHRGPLADVPKTYGKLVAFAAAHGHELVGATWDEFASDPRTTPEADLVTHVFVAVKPAS